MIKLKRAYDAYSRNDGKRVLVDRLWPRGLRKDEAMIDLWMKDIAPSSELRKWFSHEPSKWQEFRQRYRQELKDKEGLVEGLREESNKGTVTLLFSAKDREHNNAVVLKEMIEQKKGGVNL
jgi:uncharacterized protein YeaO (DUF488 family)